MLSCGFSHLQSWNAVSLILLMFSLLLSLLIYGYKFYNAFSVMVLDKRKYQAIEMYETTRQPLLPPSPQRKRGGGGGMGIAQKLVLALV